MFANRDALPLVMMAATSWLQAAMSGLKANGRRGLLVDDEVWALLESEQTARHLQARLKLCRDRGIANILVTHRLSDLRVAAELQKPIATIRRLIDLGWDINAKNRTTALHEAAMLGDLDRVRALVALGADPTIHNDSFDATPAGWAEHFGNDDARQYLDGLTRQISQHDA